MLKLHMLRGGVDSEEDDGHGVGLWRRLGKEKEKKEDDDMMGLKKLANLLQGLCCNKRIRGRL